MKDRRYQYRVIELENSVELVRDDGYRWAFLTLETGAANAPTPDDPSKGQVRHSECDPCDSLWTHLFEYKQCEFPGIACEIMGKLLGSLVNPEVAK